MNVAKADLGSLLKDAEISAIFSSLGTVPGKAFNVDDVRYSRIVILTDADTDGLHIRCLLLTLFYYYAHDLLDQGRIFYAIPPLYTIRVTGQPDKYAYSDTERDIILAGLGKTKSQISRFKGLGEMDVEELAVTCLNPQTRTLRRVLIEDAEMAATMFEMLMGDQVQPRREFIVSNAPGLSRDALDI
jgi:DNA gyrase subunit B